VFRVRQPVITLLTKLAPQLAKIIVLFTLRQQSLPQLFIHNPPK
jgi:hypothetical protein